MRMTDDFSNDAPKPSRERVTKAELAAHADAVERFKARRAEEEARAEVQPSRGPLYALAIVVLWVVGWMALHDDMPDEIILKGGVRVRIKDLKNLKGQNPTQPW